MTELRLHNLEINYDQHDCNNSLLYEFSLMHRCHFQLTSLLKPCRITYVEPRRMDATVPQRPRLQPVKRTPTKAIRPTS